MKSLAQRLIAIDEELDRVIDRLSGRFMVDVDSVNRRWRGDILDAVNSLETEGLQLKATAANQRRARNAEAAVRRGLARSGFDRVVQQHVDAFPEVIELAAKGLRAAGVKVSVAKGVDTLVTYRLIKIGEFNRLADRTATEIATTIGRAVVSQQLASEVVVEVAEQLQTFAHEARTLYDTAASEMAQTLTMLQADTSAQRVYLYSGPIDSRIRGFCLDVMGKVFSRGRIDRMDNRQLPNTFLTRGGYNCRHQWRDVTEIPDLARLADSNKIVTPELAARVAAMRSYLRVAGRQKGVRTA